MSDERPGGAMPPDPDFAPQAPATPPPATPPPPLAPYANPAAPPPPPQQAWSAPPQQQQPGWGAQPPPPPQQHWGAPPQQQPAVAWAAPAAAPVVQGKRTTLAAIAGIISLIGGILWALLGVAVAVLGGAFMASFADFYDFSGVPELEGTDPAAFLGGIAAFFGILIATLGVVYIIAGIGIVRGSNWARVLGIIFGIIGGLFWLSSVQSAETGVAAGGPDTMLFSLAHLAANGYMVIVLMLFWKSKPGTA